MDPICIAVCKNGKPCTYKAKYGSHCGIHKVDSTNPPSPKFQEEVGSMLSRLSIDDDPIFMHKAISQDIANHMFEYLKSNIQWVEGIRSRNGFTRKAKPLFFQEDINVWSMVDNILSKMDRKFVVNSIYLNYYEDGEMYTPEHVHKDTWQLVISLGATRIFTLKSKKFSLENGDVVVFSDQKHGVPKAPGLKDGRISIATFMTLKS